MEKLKLKHYLSYMHTNSKGYRKYIPLIFVCSLCFSILSIFIALIGKQLIDNLLTMNNNVIVKVILISISAYLIGAILGFFTSYFEKYIIDKFKMKLQLAFYDNMQKSEFVFFSNLSSSDVYYRMFTDIGIMVDFYLNLCITIPIKVIVFIVAASIMFVWSYQLTLAIIGLVLLQMVIMLIFRKPIRKRAEIALASDQKLIAKINEDVIKSDLCRSLALEEYNLNNITSYFDESRKNRLKSSKVSLLYSSIVGLTSQIINICLLLIGIFFVSKEIITIGMLMGISMLAGYIYQPINDFFKTIISYQSTIVSYKRFYEFNNQIDINRVQNDIMFENGDIKIENLFYMYGNKIVFQNFNAIINKNQITLLKGPNGSGKTTLMRLLTRSLRPMNGNIIISDKNINEYDFNDYRKNIISLSSIPLLLNGTLRENICANENFSDEEIVSILNKCCLMNVVERLPQGIETKLGLGETGLSQGEIQKIALARVLIRKPNILILDEPLAHIDVASVEDIQQVLLQYNKETNSTIIIISHDARVEQIVDKVIDLKNNCA